MQGAGAEEEGGPLPTQQLVFFVRHAQSRWNRAQEDLSLLNMLSESDHGLSEDGLKQAEALRERVQRALASDANMDPLLDSMLRPDAVCTSPFMRAVQTAAVGFQDLLRQEGRELLLMPEAREQKNLGSRDSTGVSVGEEIRERVIADTRNLYEACSLEKAKAAVEDLAGIKLDLSGVQDSCWCPGMLDWDTDADLEERIEALLHRLRKTRGSEMSGGGTNIVVGHSLFIRAVFQLYLRDPRACPVGIAESLRSKLLPFCGVVGARFEWTKKGKARIVEAVPVLGTQLTESDVLAVDRKQENRIGGCVCGRGNTSCIIS